VLVHISKGMMAMALTIQVDKEIQRMVRELSSRQSEDGSWRFSAESSPMTDAYMIILLRALDCEEEILISQLTERLLHRQEDNGAWKVYCDENAGNLSATIEAYFALLYSNLLPENDPRLVRAKIFIHSCGGLAKAEPMTKVMLALNGQYSWKSSLLLSLGMLLLPTGLPMNFFNLSSYSRVHIAPVMVAAHFRFHVRNQLTPDLSDLVIERPYKHHPQIPLSNRWDFFQGILNIARKRGERYMLERIEADGTLYGYFSATFLMIYALLSLGYDRHHPVIAKALDGLKSLSCLTNDGTLHVQNFTSTIWDTALISYAMQEAGESVTNPTILNALQYLLNRQHIRYGDWHIHNVSVKPGGWGFSDLNTLHPDIDDTTAALRAISRMHKIQAASSFTSAWNRGLDWLWSMQNDNGGWASFEKNTNLQLLKWLPYEQAKEALEDLSSADLTGRVLEFLGNHAGFSKDNYDIDRAIRWLLCSQEQDGSWFGRWGISYIYGTWAGITGLIAVGISKNHPAVRKAVDWLKSIQNCDGGFSESCQSDIQMCYIPLGNSTPSHTAWAADALISAGEKNTPEIEKAISRLLAFSDQNDWTTSYPTGAGMPGGFYIHYHSYRWIWPLLALAKYKNEFPT
jgi:sporulenol synthase